jgi:hypothetical protein
MELLFLLLISPCLQAGPEEQIREDDFDAVYAAVVRACEAAERTSKTDPLAALRALEQDVIAKPPPLVETTLVVKYTKGVLKGAEKERHAFFPFRLAGQCALAAGLPDVAVGYLEKSPASGDLLEQARQAQARRTAAPPAFALEPFLERNHYAGALKALATERERLGPEYDGLVKTVRERAAAHQAAQTSAVARALPRVGEATFRQEYAAPCLESCAGVPPDLETLELRWVRRLGDWTEKRDPAALDRLALEAAALDPQFRAIVDFAQGERLREIERIVEEISRVPREERPMRLARLQEARGSLEALLAVAQNRVVLDGLAALLSRLPIDDEALDRARTTPLTLDHIPALADELDRLWTSDRRAKLSLPDQADLALYLGICRAYWLFLQGKRIDEVARDPRVREVFLAAGPLPAGVSPKLVEARGLIQ